MQQWLPIIIGGAVAMVLILSVAMIARNRLGLSINETATLLLSAGSLVVAALAYRQSLDNADMREALGRLTYLGEQAFRQANATQMQVSQLREQTTEMGRQTGVLRTTAASTTALAGATAAQFTQRDQQFALEQKPDVRWDPNVDAKSGSDFFGDDHERGLVIWRFYFKNFGKSTARGLTFTEGISLNNQPFVEAERRTGDLGPGETGYTDVIYPAGAGNLPVSMKARPTLRVVFRYNDQLGRRYTQTICQRLDPPVGNIRHCLLEPVVKLPGIPIDRFRPQ